MHAVRKDLGTLVLSLAVAALTACGGGGDSDNGSVSAGTASNSPAVRVTTSGSNTLESTATNKFPANAGSSVPANTGGNVPTNTGGNVPTNTGGNVPTNTGSSVPANAGGNAPANTGSNVPAKIPAGGGSDAAASSSSASEASSSAASEASSSAASEASSSAASETGAAQSADTVPEWTAQSYKGGSVVRANGKCYVAKWWAEQNQKPPADPWKLSPSCSTADVAGTGTAKEEAPVDWTKWTAGGKASGTIHFHLLIGASEPQDQLLLDGGRYNDLIMSNIIAGVLYGHLTKEYFPGMQYNKDYLYGSILGQLLQENLSTQLYDPRKDVVDPSPDQVALLGVGQGGPYQINFYAAEMVAGGFKPAGHALINYIAVQKNIGYSMAEAEAQFGKPTPPSFNNKYYGPVLTSYFHYNDLVALAEIGKGEGGWTTPWQPNYDQAMKNFLNLPDNFLDVIANVAYNQGFYGVLLPKYASLAVTATAETVKTVNSYASVWGKSDTYEQYPYQVRYYLDQFYNNPIPTTDPGTTVVPQNQVEFAMPMLRTIFGKVFHTLAWLPQGASTSEFIPEERATTAFDSALTEHKQGADAVLDLSKSADRAIIFGILEDAITKLEAANGSKFNATTNKQL